MEGAVVDGSSKGACAACAARRCGRVRAARRGGRGCVVPASVAEPLLDFDEPGETRDPVRREARHALGAREREVSDPQRAVERPRARSRTCATRPRTSYDEVYLVLDAKVDADGQPWLHIRIPMRPNGRTGWVPADMLGPMKTVTTQLVIDRTAKRAKLYKAGRKIWEAAVGIGKSGTPTPRGQLLHPRAAARQRRGVRPVGVRHERLLEHLRLAQRGRRRHPRHEPAGADPGHARRTAACACATTRSESSRG